MRVRAFVSDCSRAGSQCSSRLCRLFNLKGCQLMGILSALSSNGVTGLVLYAIAISIMIFSAMPIHECSHAFMAKILGDDTAQRSGRLTLNPMAHLNMTGVILMILIGFGWAEPVPVNPTNFKNQKRRQGYMALVAFAGPLSNLVMCFFWLLVYRAFMCFDMTYSVYSSISYVFSLLIFINAGLAVFNLLPISPLDGSRIFNWILPDKVAYSIEKFFNSIRAKCPPVLYLILFWVVINLLSTPLGYLENWLVNDVLLNLADAIFSLLGLGYGQITL